MNGTPALLLSLIVAAGCSGVVTAEADSGAAPVQRQLVEMLSWWHAAGEADALQAVIQLHADRHPEARVFNAAADSAGHTRKVIGTRLSSGDPPDLLQLNSRELRSLQRKYPGVLRLRPLDDLVDAMGPRPVALAEAFSALSNEGLIIAMPVNVHRESSVIFNKAVFAAHNLSLPRSIPELLAACKVLKRAGVTPIATARQSWMVRIMLNSIVAGHMGSEAFRAFFSQRAETATLEAKLRQAVTAFGEIFDNYTNPAAVEEDFWTNATEALFNGDAAMLFNGDWAKGYLVQLGWRPGQDFAVTSAPGTSDLFLYVVDGFAIPEGSVNEAGARAFLRTVASPEGQVAFNVPKGSTPIRSDVPRSALDSFGRDTLEDFVRARVRMVAPNSLELDEAVMRFLTERDVEALLRAYRQYRGT